MLKNASNQSGANSVTVATKSRPRMLVASKAAVFGNYLAVSPWILNGPPIECHEKKHQPFILSFVRFGSRAFQISGWKICLALEESIFQVEWLIATLILYSVLHRTRPSYMLTAISHLLTWTEVILIFIPGDNPRVLTMERCMRNYMLCFSNITWDFSWIMSKSKF